MGSGKRGALAVVGIIAGFLTLVFLSQMFRYMTPALYGDQLSLGMWGIYVVLTYTGATVALWSFVPRASVGKYLGGAGGAVAAVLVLLSMYLFVTGGIASGMMLLIITGGQVAVAGVVYAVGRSRSGDESDSDPPSTPVEPEPDPGPAAAEPDPEPAVERAGDTRDSTSEPDPEPEPDTHPGPDPASRDIDWSRGVQVFTGVVVFLIGIPITIASPVGVPILVLGLALIPRVRSWSMRTLGRTDSESAN